MNYNLEVGDYWYFDLEHEICLLVIAKQMVESSGISYPALIVEYKSQHETSKHRVWSYQDLITPLNPNPLLMGEHFTNVRYPTWEVFKTDEMNEQPTDQWIPDYHYSNDYRSGLHLDITWDSHNFEGISEDYQSKANYYIAY
ncbi:MAG: hypothetical protein P8I55_04330 [Crocinitomix sp.]|nr:hypothetical protein [Crocinitomix sp.]